MAWLCIDAGTSVIKSVVFSAEGRELAIARSSVAVLRPQPGMAEQDMQEVRQAVLSTARRAVAEAGEPIHAIASTAQGDGVWLVDKDLRPVANAILWNDGRAHAEVDALQSAGALERGAQISGSVSYPGLPNSIWRWLETHRPDLLERAHASLTCNAWLFASLTGRIAADLSDASNPFCDVHARDYSPELLALYGVTRWKHLLPPLERNTAPTGPLLASIASELGIPVGTPVVMAPYDILATAFGAGSIAPGQACVILGTTICAEAITTTLDLSASGTTIALTTPGVFLRAMPTLTGCEALEWTAKLLKFPSMDAMAEAAATCAPGSDGAQFLPYLSPAGERSPFLNPHARGSWSHLSLTHTDAHLARSVYEGLTFVIRECLAAATSGAPSEVRVCGGGARSNFWCQMIADVTGCTVVRPDEQELGAKGALLCGRVALSEAADLAAAFSVAAGTEKRFTPNPGLRAAYDRAFARFQRARRIETQRWNESTSEAAHD